MVVEAGYIRRKSDQFRDFRNLRLIQGELPRFVRIGNPDDPQQAAEIFARYAYRAFRLVSRPIVQDNPISHLRIHVATRDRASSHFASLGVELTEVPSAPIVSLDGAVLIVPLENPPVRRSPP